MFFWKKKITSRAIAYIKPAIRPNDSPTINLSHDDSPVMMDLAYGLYVCYMIDEGNCYRYVQNRDLVKDGISPSQLHETGLRNLKQLADSRMRVEPHSNIFAVLMGGDFEASLILIDDLWEKTFRNYVTGQYAASIAARDILAFCDASSTAGCRELNELIGRIYPMGDHLISPEIWLRVGQTWQPKLQK